MADENVNNAVDELLQQLQTGNTPKPAVVSQEMSKEDIEKFLLQHSSQLIKGTVEFVEDLKKYIISAPTAEDVTAMATLVNSSAAAIETLNKVLLTNNNIDAKISWFDQAKLDIEFYRSKGLAVDDFKKIIRILE
jgi:virulence-associated protein VapD